MAEELISEIVSKEAFQQLIDLNRQLHSVKDSMSDLISEVGKFSQELSNAGNVKDAATAMESLNNATEKLNSTNGTRLDLERRLKAEGEAMAKAVQQESNNFEKLADVMEKHAKSQGYSANEIRKLQNAMSANKNAVNDLKTAYQQGKISTEEYRKEQNKLITGKEELSQRMREEKTNLKNATRDLTSAEGSYNQMSARLSQLKQIYKDLSKEERENANVGGVLKAEINNLDEALKGMDASIGDNQRSVGNYRLALQNLRDPMKLLDGGIKGIGASLKALLANPVVLSLGAVALLFKKVADAIKKNDDSMTALQTSFEAFRPLLKLVGDGFQALGTFVAKVATGVADLATKIASKLNPALGEQMNKTAQLVRLQDKLEDQERELTKASAARQNVIAELTNKAYERDKYSLQERIGYLEQAIELERMDIEERKRIAAQKWYYAKKDAENNNNTTDEIKNNITSLLAEYMSLDKELAEHNRRRLSRLQSLRKEEANATNARIKEIQAEQEAAWEAQDKAREREVEQNKRNADFLFKAREVNARLIDDAKIRENTLYGLRKEAIEREREEAINAGNDKVMVNKYYDALLLEAEQDYWNNLEAIQNAESEKYIAKEKENAEKAKQAADMRKQAYMEMGDSVANLGATMAQFVSNERERVVMEQVIAVAQMMIKQGIAIAELIANEAKEGFFIPKVIADVATLAATFASAINAVKSVNMYAEGTDYHRGGASIIGEGVKNGHFVPEIVSTPSGQSFLVTKPTLFSNLPIGSSVTPTADLTETNDLLGRIAGKEQVVINVDDHITAYIVKKNARTKILNTKFKA